MSVCISPESAIILAQPSSLHTVPQRMITSNTRSSSAEPAGQNTATNVKLVTVESCGAIVC